MQATESGPQEAALLVSSKSVSIWSYEWWWKWQGRRCCPVCPHVYTITHGAREQPQLVQ